MPYLQLQDISKRFSGVMALAPLTLDIRKGRFVTILGPSGCGKSTLLNIISGIIAPDSGHIFLEGADITALAPEKRHFGVVFQQYALFPAMTVRDNIMYGLRGPLWSTAKRQARVAELMDLVQLQGLEHRYPDQLSGGQQQRVALARALAPEPKLLLLDEPLSALDAKVRDTLGQELLRIQRTTGLTTIMVTHDQAEALALADTIILFNEGRVAQAGPPKSLYSQPATRFVAEFIGHMNIVQIPSIANGSPVGIRHEDVRVERPSEVVLAQPYTWVAKILHISLMGAFYRLELLLNDFTTSIHAAVPHSPASASYTRGELVSVTLPEECWCTWQLQQEYTPLQPQREPA